MGFALLCSVCRISASLFRSGPSLATAPPCLLVSRHFSRRGFSRCLPCLLRTAGGGRRPHRRATPHPRFRVHSRCKASPGQDAEPGSAAMQLCLHQVGLGRLLLAEHVARALPRISRGRSGASGPGAACRRHDRRMLPGPEDGHVRAAGGEDFGGRILLERLPARTLAGGSILPDSESAVARFCTGTDSGRKLGRPSVFLSTRPPRTSAGKVRTRAGLFRRFYWLQALCPEDSDGTY